MVQNFKSRNTEIIGVEVGSDEFNAVNVPSSAALGLPDKCSIDKNPSFGVIVYNNLKDDDGLPRKGLGVEVTLADGKTKKCLSVSSFTRTHFLSEPKKDKDNTFDTRNIARRNVIDKLQGVETLSEAPADIVTKYLAGKTIELKETVEVFTPKTYDDVTRRPTSYEKTKKKFFVVSDSVKAETAAEKKARLLAEKNGQTNP
jgi:hypothetical protein